VKPIGPNFRRFISPTDPGDVELRAPRRRRPPSDQPKEGAKPLNLPADHPQGDWLRNRTLHHFPHEALAGKLGVAAFGMVVLLLVMTSLLLFDGNASFKSTLVVVSIVAILLANGFGIASQILSGGRSWIGAVAMASVWICAIIWLVIVV